MATIEQAAQVANRVTTTLTVQTNLSHPAIDAGYLENLKVGYRNSFEKIFAETAPLIRAEFGDWLIDSDVRKVIRAWQENALCANCSGFPCQKYKGVKGFVNIIRPFEDELLYSYLRRLSIEYGEPSYYRFLNHWFRGAQRKLRDDSTLNRYDTAFDLSGLFRATLNVSDEL